MRTGPLRIVITGASGFVGMQLVPLLRRGGAELLLAGRDPNLLRQRFPGVPACSYDDLGQAMTGYDMLLHLAVANNNADLPDTAFREINVELTLSLANQAREAGIRKFINISSTHALDAANLSAYARTKREGVLALSAMSNIAITTFYLPPVYGDQWSGRLSVLNKLPRPLAQLIFTPLAALTPTLNAARLADYLLNDAITDSRDDAIITDGQRNNLVYRTIMRALDLTFAVAVAGLLWWLLIAVWVLIRLQSPGPGIFAQARVGRHGKHFTCYKFRTMELGTIEAATNTVAASSVTRLGAFLRRTKVDELPQIWNIFRNEISLIGPRPCLPVQTELVEARLRAGVLTIKPGISGLAQINAIDMSDPQRLTRWDARYVALQSLLLDLRIVIATATGRGQGDRVAKE